MACLRKLTKEDVIKFYKGHISSSEGRRKISCHVVSTCDGGAGGLETSDCPQSSSAARQVTDITTFKSSLPLFPLAQPFVELETLKRPSEQP